MANPDPSRTEWPTGKKLGDARSKGNVLSCPDINSVVILVVGTLLLFMTIPRLADAFRDILFTMARIDCRGSWIDSQIAEGGVTGGYMLLRILAPACFGIFLAAILVMRAQVGRFFSFQPLKWKMGQLFNPKAVMNEMLPSKQNFRRVLISTSKVFVVGWLIYMSIHNQFDEYLKLNMIPLFSGVMWIVKESVMLVFKLLAIMVFIAAVSYYLRRKQYYDNLMMTKQEVKDEHKNQDGDPMVKGKIRSKMREVLLRAIKGNMKNANVVITNPTHVAVALRYDPKKDFAPMVVAKGLRKRAEHIKKMARSYGIPIVEAPPLARSLYRNVKVTSYIPSEFYKAVAAILAKIYNRKKDGRAGAPAPAPAKEPLRKAA